MGWFEVDKQGLGKLLRRRGMQFVLYELVQNAWDTQATEVSVTLTPVAGRPLAELVVVDDDPDGFQDIAHAFTLFAESNRKGLAEKRGRFNLGEKLVLAVCEQATITTTTGTVVFEGAERTKRKTRREHGSEFRGILRMSREELREVEHAATLLIPPPNVATTFGGERLATRQPCKIITAALPTEIAGDDGVLRRTTRKTAVRIYERKPGAPARIYELGIPICETGDTYDVEVMQKVPLNIDRDNVTPAYLKAIRVEVLNAMASEVRPEVANEPWVQQAINDDRAEPKAVVAAVQARFGQSLVDYDPRDRESNATAFASGYTVVPSNALGKVARAKMREANALPMAGDSFPTQGPGTAPSQLLDESDLSDGMRAVRSFSVSVCEALLGFCPSVQFVRAPDAGMLASYSSEHKRVTFNVSVLGEAWFDHGLNAGVTRLVLHELAHHAEASHLSTRYTDSVCDLAARFAHIVAHDPTRFGELVPVDKLAGSKQPDPPDGTPNVRSVSAPCEFFEPGSPGRGDCNGDGHYLCRVCREFSERKD